MPTASAPRGSRTAHPCGPAVPPRPALVAAPRGADVTAAVITGHWIIYLFTHSFIHPIYLFIYLCIAPPPPLPSPRLFAALRPGRPRIPRDVPRFLPRPLPAREHHRAGVYITAPRRRPPGTPRIPHRGAGGCWVVGEGAHSPVPHPAPGAGRPAGPSSAPRAAGNGLYIRHIRAGPVRSAALPPVLSGPQKSGDAAVAPLSAQPPLRRPPAPRRRPPAFLPARSRAAGAGRRGAAAPAGRGGAAEGRRGGGRAAGGRRGARGGAGGGGGGGAARGRRRRGAAGGGAGFALPGPAGLHSRQQVWENVEFNRAGAAMERSALQVPRGPAAAAAAQPRAAPPRPRPALTAAAAAAEAPRRCAPPARPRPPRPPPRAPPPARRCAARSRR